MKVGTIALLAIGILVARPEVQMPAVTEFASNGAGPAFAGSLFPLPLHHHRLRCPLRVPRAHLLGDDAQAHREGEPGPLHGYDSMLTESFLAIMALVAAVSIDQHIYFAMNAPGASTGGTPEGAADFVNGLPLLTPGGGEVPPIDPARLQEVADSVGEETIVSRTGGAPTLAFGMSEVMSVFGGEGLKSFWYHFAVMFEALFILTTVDAGTRVARFMFSDAIGNRLRDGPDGPPGVWGAAWPQWTPRTGPVRVARRAGA